MKRALVTGCSGQDGSYLCELLLQKGYDVWGTIRRSSSINTGRINHIFGDLNLRYADLNDGESLTRVIREARPDEVYNLAAQSHVRTSFDIPQYTADVTGLGVLRMLEATRQEAPQARFYQASSSEIFGSSPAPQDLDTPMLPCSPYGISKLFGYHAAKSYRAGYGMYVVNGVLFNHESPRRGETFVSRKITKAAARIYFGLQDKLVLGNLDAKRDWGYAPEYVKLMWRMLQENQPHDYIVATGEMHTVREFVKAAFDFVGLNWGRYVQTDSKYFRPNEVSELQGKVSLLPQFKPQVGFNELVSFMMNADIMEAKRERESQK